MACAHITISSVDRLPLFPDEGGRREAVRALARVAGDVVVVFCIVDDHVHVAVFSGGRGFPSIARSIRLALVPISSAPLGPPHIKAIEDRAHLRSTVAYLLRQVDHHGLSDHAATWSGSSFLDLVGARSLPGLTLRLPELLPRFRRWDALCMVGLTEAPHPLDPQRVRQLGAARIVTAASAVHAAPPGLAGNAAPVIAARRTAARLGAQCEISSREMAWALKQTQRSARRAIAGGSDAAVRATRIRLALEELVARHRITSASPAANRDGQKR